MSCLRLVLASKSPRREMLLKAVGLNPLIVPSKVDEDGILTGDDPLNIVMSLARAKVQKVCGLYPDDCVVGADTLVYLHNRVLGKPKDSEDAKEMLATISGCTHTVYTGLALYSPKDKAVYVDADATKVKIRSLSPEEIEWYVGMGEPMDKAGAYALQGVGGLFVEEIEGDYSGVVGLPLPKFYELLKRNHMHEFFPRMLACEGE